jgi:nuclear pore complex protein Nup93
LIEIVKENPNAKSPTDPDAVKERQYADDYLEESRNSAKTVAIRKRIIDGSRKTLEKQLVDPHLICNSKG